MQPGRLSVYFRDWIGLDYRVVSTDYDSYFIIYSCIALFTTIKLQDSHWVMTRNPIVIGSPEYDAMIALVEPIFAEKLPNLDRDGRKEDIYQGPGCQYFTT